MPVAGRTDLSCRTVREAASGARMNADRVVRGIGNGVEMRGVCEATNENVNVLPLPTPAEVAEHDPPSSCAGTRESSPTSDMESAGSTVHGTGRNRTDLCELLADGETESGPAVRAGDARVNLTERLEQPVQLWDRTRKR